jgi:hypothetical protein
MLPLLLGAALLLYWIWSRSPAVRAGGWRIGAGLISAVLVVIGAALSLRGDWPIGLPIAGIGLFLAFAGRINRGGQRRPAASGEAMSVDEARSILGVGEGASAAEVQSAYLRLMKLNHPDQGGTTGLASKLNAARERLLKAR